MYLCVCFSVSIFLVVSKRMFVFAAVHIYVFCVCLNVCVRSSVYQSFVCKCVFVSVTVHITCVCLCECVCVYIKLCRVACG